MLPYLNRLSDALFVMARYENHERGVDEPLWQPDCDVDRSRLRRLVAGADPSAEGRRLDAG